MNITHLQSFCTPVHNTLIEVTDNEQRRWLFATDGHRAVGFQTNEITTNLEDKTSSKVALARNILQTERKYFFLNRQRFMAFLHASEEKEECSECQDTGMMTCMACGGDGTVECSECEGSGVTYNDCDECDGSGKKQEDCDECDGKGKTECECDECSATGTHEYDCDQCGGTGFEDDEEEKKCRECVDGKVEGDCEYCTEGKIEESCSYCDEGQVEKDCSDCDDGQVEKDCQECDCGNVECGECDENHEQECDECGDEEADRGKIYGQTFNLEFFRDLSMDFFDEIAPGTDRYEPIIIRGKGRMAFVMPMNVSDCAKEYIP